MKRKSPLLQAVLFFAPFCSTLVAQTAPPSDPAATTDFTVSESMPTPTPVPPALVAARSRLQAQYATSAQPRPVPVAIEVFVNDLPIGDKQTRLLPLATEATRIEARLGPALFVQEAKPVVGAAAVGGRDIVVEQSVQSRLRFRVSSGSVVTLAPGVIDWRPSGSEGVVTVSIEADGQLFVRDEIEAATQSAVSHQEGLEEGPLLHIEYAFSLVAPLAFDREGDGTLAGTMVGIYPNERAGDVPGVVARNAAAYAPPAALYKLDAQTANVELAPGLTLGTLNPPAMPEAEGEGARYVAVSPRLPEYWTALRAEIDRTGMKPGALRVLRGFVSPHERARLGRLGVVLAPFTRHQYGDAVVLIYDADGDGRQDDLNSDGQTTIADAEVLADWAERAMRASNRLGGIGVIAAYKAPESPDTPAVQVDVRGWFDRWKEE